MKNEPRRNKQGFTLIEIICVLILIGIVASGTSLLLGDLMQGYVQTRTSTTSAETVQLALTRIIHELSNINVAKSYTLNGSTISYYYQQEATSTTIALNNNQLQINGNTLLDNVTAFTATNPCTVRSQSLSQCADISITINVGTANGPVPMTFTTTIFINPQNAF